MLSRRGPAFTLVEILIVVVVLGILAAIVVPQLTRAQSEAASNTAVYELAKLRRAIEIYEARNDGLPEVAAGDGTWGALVTTQGEYLKEAPWNPWVGTNGRVIIIRGTPDDAYQTTYGWIFDDATGHVWLGGFNADDEPLPRN